VQRLNQLVLVALTILPTFRFGGDNRYVALLLADGGGDDGLRSDQASRAVRRPRIVSGWSRPEAQLSSW